MSSTVPKKDIFMQMKSDIEAVSIALHGTIRSQKQRIDALSKWRGAIHNKEDTDNLECILYKPELIDKLEEEIFSNKQNLDEDYLPPYLFELEQLLASVNLLKDFLDKEKPRAIAEADAAHTSVKDVENDSAVPPKFEYPYIRPNPNYLVQRQQEFEKYRAEWEKWINTPQGIEWTLDYESYKGEWRKKIEYSQSIDRLFDDIIKIRKIILTNVTPKVETNERGAIKINDNLINDLYEALKPFFSSNQHTSLRCKLLGDNDGGEKLLFNGNGIAFAQAFKDIYSCSQTAISGKKIELERWILRNFQYKSGKQVKDFTEKYLNDIISTDIKECMNPILKVKLIDAKDGKVKFEQTERRDKKKIKFSRVTMG